MNIYLIFIEIASRTKMMQCWVADLKNTLAWNFKNILIPFLIS